MITSRLAVRTVHPAIEYADDLKETIQVKGGKKVIIDTKISGVPKPSVEWTFDDVAMVPTDNIFIETNTTSSRVTILEASTKETGRFNLTLTNIVGSATAGFNVVVKGKRGTPGRT